MHTKNVPFMWTLLCCSRHTQNAAGEQRKDTEPCLIRGNELSCKDRLMLSRVRAGAAEGQIIKFHEDTKVASIDGEMANGSMSLEFKVLTDIASKRRAVYGLCQS